MEQSRFFSTATFSGFILVRIVIGLKFELEACARIYNEIEALYSTEFPAGHEWDLFHVI